MSALPMGYDQPDFPLLTGVPDLVHSGDPANDLPFGLPPLPDEWWDQGCFPGGGGCGPGLPYDLYGEDNGDSSGMPFGLLDEATIDEINGGSGGGVADVLAGGGIGDALGGGLFGNLSGIGAAVGGLFGNLDGLGGALGGGLFGNLDGLGGAVGGGGGALGGLGGGIRGAVRGAVDLARRAGGTAKDYLEGYEGDGGCIPQYDDMIVY